LGDSGILQNVLTDISIHLKNAVGRLGFGSGLRIRAGLGSAVALLLAGFRHCGCERPAALH